MNNLGILEMEEILSPKEVSKLLKVSKPWPYVQVKRGLLPHYKMGKLLRFKRSDIEKFLEETRVEKRK